MRNINALTLIDSIRSALDALASRSDNVSIGILSKSVQIAANDTRTLVVALREIAARLPAGDPSRILAMDALRLVGIHDKEPPPEGRKVTLTDYKGDAHGTRSQQGHSGRQPGQ